MRRRFVERLNDASEVRKAAGQPVDLVDDNHVDLARSDVGEKLLESWPGDVAAGPAAIVVVLVDSSQPREPGSGCRRHTPRAAHRGC